MSGNVRQMGFTVEVGGMMQMIRGRVLSHATGLAHGRAGRRRRSSGRRSVERCDAMRCDRLESGQTERSCESIWPYTVMSRAVGGFATSAPAGLAGW